MKVTKPPINTSHKKKEKIFPVTGLEKIASKCLYLAKTMYRFNEFLIAKTFSDLKKRTKRNHIETYTHTTLNCQSNHTHKNEAKGVTVSHSKTYCRAVATNTAWCCTKQACRPVQPNGNLRY